MIELKKILEIIGNNSKTIDGWGDTIWVDTPRIMVEIFNASKNKIELEDIFKNYFSEYKYELKDNFLEIVEFSVEEHFPRIDRMFDTGSEVIAMCNCGEEYTTSHLKEKIKSTIEKEGE